MKIKTHSYSECINELTLGLYRNNLNAIFLAIPIDKKSLKQLNFGNYDAIKLLIKAISVIAKVLTYHLRHHCKDLHGSSTFAVIYNNIDVSTPYQT